MPWGVCALMIGASLPLVPPMRRLSRWLSTIVSPKHVLRSANSTTGSRKRRPAWATQAWHLVKADILALAGNSRGAFAAASNGARGKNGRLLTKRFCRAPCEVAEPAREACGTERATLAALREQAKAIRDYHAKDRAEVLAAIAMLEDRAGEDAAGTWREVEDAVETLPKTVTTVMRRLGTLRDARLWEPVYLPPVVPSGSEAPPKRRARAITDFGEGRYSGTEDGSLINRRTVTELTVSSTRSASN